MKEEWIVPKFAFRQFKHKIINLRKLNLLKLLATPVTQTKFNYNEFYMNLISGDYTYSTDCGQGYKYNFTFILDGRLIEPQQLNKLTVIPKIFFVNKFYNGEITKDVLENVMFHDYRLVVPTSDRAKDIQEEYQILCLWNPHIRTLQVFSPKVNINKKLCLFNNSKYIRSEHVADEYLKYIERDLMNIATHMNEISQI